MYKFYIHFPIPQLLYPARKIKLGKARQHLITCLVATLVGGHVTVAIIAGVSSRRSSNKLSCLALLCHQHVVDAGRQQQM